MAKAAIPLILTILSPLAHAQEQAPAMPDNLDGGTILVTAIRPGDEETIAASKDGGDERSTPQAISSVGRAFIDAMNLRTVAEALNYTSGVRSQSFGSDTRIEYYQLRGFRNESFYKDGLVLTNSGPFLSWTTPAEGIERLEVLKGPSSVLFGGGSAGGMVHIVSKQPGEFGASRLEVGADEYGSIYGSTDIDAAVSDALAVRANALVRRGDTQNERAEDNRTYGAIAVGWKPSSDTMLTLRVSYTRDRSQRPAGGLPYAGYVAPLPDGRRIPINLFVSDPSIDRYDRDQYEVGYTFETRPSDALRFVSNGRYAKIDLVYAGLFARFDSKPVIDRDKTFVERASSFLHARLSNVTLDSHLDGRFETGVFSHILLGGIDYARSETQSEQASGAAPRLDVFDPVYGISLPAPGGPVAASQRIARWGIYLQDRIALGGLTGLFSLRHDRIDAASWSKQRIAQRQTNGKTSYRAGLSYEGLGDMVPFVSYSTSFTPLFGIDESKGEAYRPETGEGWEAGIKYRPNDGPLRAAASLFMIERGGILVANPVPGFPRNQSQGGRVRSRGGEIEVQARPLKSLGITAAVTAFKIANIEGEAALLGLKPPAVPEFTASAFVDYALPAGSILPGLGFGLGVRYSGRSFADAANRLVVPAATVFDAAVHYDFRSFRLAANISNLLDKAYVAACPAAGTCYPANLRRATISLAYRFGKMSPW